MKGKETTIIATGQRETKTPQIGQEESKRGVLGTNSSGLSEKGPQTPTSTQSKRNSHAGRNESSDSPITPSNNWETAYTARPLGLKETGGTGKPK